MSNQTASVLYLPVSLGEAFDKLTILDIKLSNINDSRRQSVEAEYSALYTKLENFIADYKTLYESTKKVNILIWKLMDKLRDGNLPDCDYLKTAREMIDLNDVRFRIKNKINSITKSQYTEQKGYKINTLVIDFDEGVVITEEFIKPIRYYSYIYDQIIICIKNDEGILRSEFHYDTTIQFVKDAPSEYKWKIQVGSTAGNVLEAFSLTLSDIESIL
jgi:hypothetical protein